MQLEEGIQLRYEDYHKATGFQREERFECVPRTDKLSQNSLNEDSEDLISVESDEPPYFEELKHLEAIQKNVKGLTKEFAVDGDYDEEESQQITANEKINMKHFEENFDDLILDEGVSATKIR